MRCEPGIFSVEPGKLFAEPGITGNCDFRRDRVARPSASVVFAELEISIIRTRRIGIEPADKHRTGSRPNRGCKDSRRASP
jgi:hypothetical protein